MSRATAVADKPIKKQAKGYFQRSELPFLSLVFLLPLIVVYEIGTRYMTSDIRAFAWMQTFFHWFGASGRHLPALAVVGILLAWHIARGDSWNVSPKYLLGMACESLVLCLPLILMVRVTAHYLPMMSFNKPAPGLIVASVGAGIYEELVFRLIAFTCLHFLLIDVLEVRKAIAYTLMVVISSLAFSLYHYLGYEPFQLQSFVFRTLAGFYFGVIFAYRGFGISAGTHTAYDVIALCFS